MANPFIDTNVNPARQILSNWKLSEINGLSMYWSIVVAIVGKNKAPIINRIDDICLKLVVRSDSVLAISFVIDFRLVGKYASVSTL